MSSARSHSRVIPANEYRRERWRNGAGWTREIAAEPAGEWAWRLSIAEIEQDAPFSRFEGIDREIVLLSGNGVRLRFDDGNVHDLAPPHGRLRFAGEAGVHGELIEGATQDFNLLWRRDAIDAQLRHRPLVGPMVIFADADLAPALAPPPSWMRSRFFSTVFRPMPFTFASCSRLLYGPLASRWATIASAFDGPMFSRTRSIVCASAVLMSTVSAASAAPANKADRAIDCSAMAVVFTSGCMGLSLTLARGWRGGWVPCPAPNAADRCSLPIRAPRPHRAIPRRRVVRSPAAV